ncbi:hypothetical protein SCLCIDRAFT_1093240 [Scleroderma citrinum Foug A]|uniref:Uncharacterized protein n=1 Tax=Scleroderma citrinum Foug A TaxID=1036808 RepID=A0A0C3DQR3_9AGAM|nr:hypothetical protein SCLCIDRAFT_1093240 [Scleroderma citrinum Foug A]
MYVCMPSITNDPYYATTRKVLRTWVKNAMTYETYGVHHPMPLQGFISGFILMHSSNSKCQRKTDRLGLDGCDGRSDPPSPPRCTSLYIPTNDINEITKHIKSDFQQTS